MNHNDDGSLQPSIGNRQVTGLLTAGTAANPVLYISSSDPRISTNADTNLDTNSGIVTRVTWTGTNWVAVDILRGLPRSEENHANNGMVLSADGTKLYLAVGGNTNNGAPSSFFSYTAEYALSGTILEIDLVALNSLPILTDSDGTQINGTASARQYIYDFPTLDDPNVPNVTGGVGEDANGLDENGPFGGRDGLNMAILPADAPVRIYADGFRNHYDLVLRADGKLYTVDNGSNGGLGGNPLIVNGEAVNTPVNGGTGDPEPLFLVQDGQYYGHPNPTRANQNQAWTVYNNSGTVDTTVTVNTVPDISALVPASVNIADGFLIDPSKFTGNATRLAQSGVRIPFNSPSSPSLVELGSSSNGLVEYTGNAYGGALNGALLVAQFNNTVTLLNVNNAGTGLEPLIDPGLDGLLGTADDTVADADGVYTLITGLATPLDVTTGPNGSIWVAEIGGNFIKAYKPGATPPSNDIDNDGILNAVDPFGRDASNGTSVTLSPGQTLVWDFDPNQDNNRPGPVGFATGLTGVMSNGSTDPEVFFNSASTLPGQNIKLDNVKFATAAGGGTTVIEYVSNGDALGAANNGEYLFHTGFKLAPTIDTFTVKWSVVNPLLTGPNQQIGGYIGTGDQSNYLKIVATANPAGEIQILLENNNAVVTQTFLQADDLFTVPADKQIFFELEINPTAATATPKITYETAGANKAVTGSPISLSGTAVLNTILGNNTVQGQTTGLAVGLYSSNTGQPAAPAGPSFQALFGDITITGTGNVPVLYRVNAGGPTIAATDGGPNWVADTPFLLDPGSNTVASFPAVNPGPTVPSSTPGTIFDTERWDAAGGTEMQYGFAVTPGTYEVRLYMGNGFGGTTLPGQRVFDVAIEGQVKPNLNNIDPSAQFGHLVGGLISDTVQVTDGTLNIQFLHDTIQNPLLNGIEIVKISDLNLPTISIVGGPYSVNEAGGQVQISLLSNVIVPANQTVTVNYEIVPGTATPQVDYSAAGIFLPETGKYTGTATIAGSSADATFLVTIPQDTLVEGNETFTVNITSVSSNALIGNGSATVTIVDDDVLPSDVVVAINAGGPALTQNGINFVADTAFIGGSTYTDGVFDAAQPIFNGTIYKTERFGGAPSGAPFSYSIPVAAGNYTVELYFAEIYQTTTGSRIFDVTVEGQLVLDNLDILTQTGGDINQPFVFTVPEVISPNTFGSLDAIDISFQASVDNAKVSGIVIRTVDITQPNEVTIAQTANGAEPNVPGQFTVSLSQTAATNTVVAYSVAGTAAAGSDYTALSGTVAIPAGSLSATINVPVIDDAVLEGNETVIVTLNTITDGDTNIVLGATNEAVVTIIDNDTQPSGGEALLTINVDSNNIQVSNFGNNSFLITNTGTKNIASVVIDVTNALYPDSVFDPFGLAGDTVSKPLQIDSNGNTGVVAPSNASYIGVGGTAGYEQLRLVFNGSVNGGFQPGETIGFSVDMDPNSVAGTNKSQLDGGSSPSWDVGGVSGAELIGSSFTVTFTDGTTATGQLQGAGNQGGSKGLATQDSPNLAVDLSVNGLSAGGIGTYDSNGPSVIINGPAGRTARVVLTKGFIQPINSYAAFLDAQLDVLAESNFPANNAVEFQTVNVQLTGSNQNISNLFNFSNVAAYNFTGEDQLPLGFVASVIDPSNSDLSLGPVTQPIYLTFSSQSPQQNQVKILSTQNALEPDSNGLFTVSLSRAESANTTVAYSVGGTATAGADYTALAGTVTILAGQLSAAIPVTVLDDTAIEGTESVIVTLTGVAGATDVVLGPIAAATVSIADNDQPPASLTVQAESIINLSGYRLESNGAATGGSMLSLVGGASNETGTATFGFTGATGTYKVILGTFDENDGVSTLQVSKNGVSVGGVLLNGNLGSGLANATTKVEKTVATGVTIATGDSLTVTGIENSAEHARFDFIRFEPVGPVSKQVSIAATTQAAEPSTNGLFTVSLNQASSTPTVVSYTVGGTATSNDYIALSNTVTIATNQLSATIPVSVLDDSTIEGTESVSVTLTGVNGAADVALGTTTTATVNIADNDQPLQPLLFQAESATTVVNYRVENLAAASGGKVLSFLGGSNNESGSATFGFNEAPGTYNIILGTFDENDGLASFSVALKDIETGVTNTVGSLLLNANLGSGLANAQTKISATVATGIALTPGDTITVNGLEQASEHARLDFLQLTPTI
ncbi:MAG: malectin domain-containing carbohydrate-binding protein [Nodosilinea sp.]